ncbi:MAG: UDP-glucose 4-epimerase GalE [Candidatus Hydrogenedentota bacterium]
MKNILITGGAGYIGSHLAKFFKNKGYNIIIIDNFERSSKKVINVLKVDKYFVMDLRRDDLTEILKGIDIVFHCAAYIDVSESIRNPDIYFENNVLGTHKLLSQMKKAGVYNLIFSSSAAVYGDQGDRMLTEEDIKKPIQPYGFSKSVMEDWIEWFCKIFGFNAMVFRYFNACGCDEDGLIGEAHQPETHLIPRALHSLFNKEEEFYVYGNDYDTKDGSCIRDYIHILDIVDAYSRGIKYLQENRGFFVFNLGNNSGYSVFEVLTEIEKVTELKLKYKIVQRRIGDPAILVASNSKAREALCWKPARNLFDMISSQYKYLKRDL